LNKKKIHIPFFSDGVTAKKEDFAVTPPLFFSLIFHHGVNGVTDVTAKKHNSWGIRARARRTVKKRASKHPYFDKSK